MYAVGRVGSYITRVSAPFHPFGGAVDIVVVEQQDGSFKSSSWYVHFGKFKGGLKAKENVVDISVNGEGANFHMYLDHTGHAYFLREVDAAEGDVILSPTSSGQEMNGQDRRPVKANSWNYGDDPSDSVTQLEVSNGKVMARTGSRWSQLLGLVYGRKSMKQNKFQENGTDVVRTDSLERAEIAADLLETKWSTNLSSVREEKDNASCLSDSGVSKVGNGALRRQSTIYYETLDSSGIELDDFGEQGDEMMLLSSIQAETSPNPQFITEASSEVETQHVHGSLGDGSVLTETSSEPTSVQHIDDSAKEVESCSALTNSSLSDSISQVQDGRSIEEEDEMKRCQPFGEPFCDSQEVSSEEEQLLFSDLDDFKLREVKGTELISLDLMDKENYSSLISEEIKSDIDSFHSDFASDSSPHKFVLQGNLPNNGEELIEEAQVISSQIDIPRSSKIAGQELGGTVRSLPTIGSYFDEVGEHFLHCPLGHSLDSNFKSSKWTLLRENVSGFIKSDAESVHCLSNSQPTTVDALNFEVLKNIDTSTAVGDSSKIVKTSSGNWSAWPFAFKRFRSMKDTRPGLNCTGSLDAEISLEGTIGMDLQNKVSKPKVTKKKIRAISPTTEQLASLNLKEGGNIVTFTFSTSMLGEQQVDARVYLWQWDTRVVITDVDGTITKSDILGQFMPLVGKDWSQIGVAHLFSAIKENGYQLLFLSARAISQAGLTRQFLFNLKQDGKCLPDGPVVISHDGLFPSLFREVIRRAPHEFKIACLEDIKACFPSDRNPFYAGFGNRHTDEFSYLKVGIPIGKIFIINPKGEVVVNHCDNKSYTSLHALVNAMFPSMSSEQEDFNSWNFWKLPPPLIDI